MENWEAVIGLEIRAMLNTFSKLFSDAPNRFGDKPNTNITEFCTGQPGSLPVVNKEAIHKAVRFGCAINGMIARVSQFDRKSYFYPGFPRNFQITQYYFPLVVGGAIVADVDGHEKVFRVNRVHLEDESGVIKHFPDHEGIDYNRAGVPLIGIVSEPCLKSSKDAVAYCLAVEALLHYLDVSDCNREGGALLVDVNISVRPKGEEGVRSKIEMKNMDSFTDMQEAIDNEIQRQIKEYTKNSGEPPHKVITPATCRWDPEKKEAVKLHKKERAEEYRYFPESDLLPIILTEAYIEEVREGLPELPPKRKEQDAKDRLRRQDNINK